MLKLGDDMYRRGLTLGLTMAEIFILILFLLLLLLLALYASNIEDEETIEEITKTIKPATDNREVPQIELPDEIRILVMEYMSQQETITKLKEENTINAGLLEKNEKNLTQLEGELTEAKEKLGKARGKLPENIKTLTDKIDTLENALADAEEKNAENQNQIKNTQQENKNLRAQLYASKGVDPPCWYEVVLRNGKRHEKPYYLLDVAVHDEYLFVRINQNIPLSGRAIDENNQFASTSYAEEYEKLPLAHLAAVKSRKLSLVKFKEIAEPIKYMGKSGQIRDYACVFYVKVWDYTSATAKKRWQRARKKIEDFFYPLLVQNDPWE